MLIQPLSLASYTIGSTRECLSPFPSSVLRNAGTLFNAFFDSIFLVQLLRFAPGGTGADSFIYWSPGLRGLPFRKIKESFE